MKPVRIMLVAIAAFAGLCIAGFWWLRAQSAGSQEPPPATFSPPAPPAPLSRPEPAPLPARMPAPRPPPAPLPEPEVIAPRMPALGDPRPLHPAYAPLPPEVLPLSRFQIASDPVDALAPLVDDCFSDARAQYRGKLSATLVFTPLPDGGISHGDVKSLSVQDPYIEACLEDAMDDARFSPGELSDPIEHTFTFGGEDAGEAGGLR